MFFLDEIDNNQSMNKHPIHEEKLIQHSENQMKLSERDEQTDRKSVFVLWYVKWIFLIFG